MGAESESHGARPLDPSSSQLSTKVQEALRKGQHSWLKSTEICYLLLHHAALNLKVEKEPPCQPPGGSLFLFDRKAVRFFRKDKHNWRKKADGKTVRETHEKLKVGNVDMLNCYYAHADCSDGLQVPLKQNPTRVSTRLHCDKRTNQNSSEPEASPGSDSETSGDPSHASDVEATALAVNPHQPVQQPVMSFPEVPLKPADLCEPNLSCMSFDRFLAAMDSKEERGKALGQAGNCPAQEALCRWSDEDAALRLDTQSMPYSTVQQATAQQATDVGPGRPAEGNDRNDDSQIRTKTSMHELTAARWRAQGSLSEEGSAYFQHLANIRKRTRVQPQQPQQPEANDISLSDHNEPHSVSAGHLSDQELSWRLSWHQGMAVQDCLPAYDLSSSAACSSVQAAAQQQQAAPSLGDLSQSMPQQSIHLQIMSQQLLLGSQDLHPSAQSLGRNLLQANTSSQQDSPLHGSQDLRPPPSQNNKHDQMPLSAGLQSFAPQLQSQPELHTHTATMSQRHAFERPNGRSAFSLPFMNAPHSVHNRRQGPGAVAACSLAGAVTPMDVCQDHSLASTSTTNAGAWQNAVASAAGQGVLPHLRPPVNLVFQAGGTVGEYAKPPHKVSPFAIEKANLSTALDGMEHVQHAPPLPQTMSGQHALHHPPSDIAGLPQRPSGSEARRKAALSLNARLALIDKQVLQHVIPQRQQSASLLEDQDIAQQVQACEEQLRQLELNSQYLMQLSNQDTNATEASTGAHSNQQGHSGRQNGKSQILVAASTLEPRTGQDPGGQIHVMFDQTEVPATLLWPGVWSCEAPSHAAGTVDVCLTDRHGRRCSQSTPFLYRATPISSSKPRPGSAALERQLQLELVHLLLQQQPTITPRHAFATSGGMTLPDEALHQQGTSGMTRDEVLQNLVKMELEALLNQVTLPAKDPWTVETGHSVKASVTGSAATPVPTVVSCVTDHGLSLLQLTSSLGYDWAARMLFRHVADINLQGPEGFTALHWAASRGHEACVAMLLARGADPNMQTQPTDTSSAGTAADLASQAGHMGIAAFLSESSLVRCLTKLRRTTSERPLPQLASTPLPGRSPLLRKRGRLEHIPEGGQLDPSAASGLVPLYGASLPAELPAIASCPDPILDSLAVMENQAALSSADGLQGPTHMMQPLSAPCGQPPLSGPRGQHSSASNLLNMTGVGPGVQNSVWAAPEPATAGISQQGVSSRTGCNPVALAAAAKQAAVVLEQHLQRREQHLAACAQRRAKHKQREEAALSRLNDSDKMWAMLKKIAQQECTEGATPSPDSVLLRFLSLAPRVFSLNAAVKAALCDPVPATLSTQGDLNVGQAGVQNTGSNGCCPSFSQGLPATRSAPQGSIPLKPDGAAIMDRQAANLAVRHVEAILGNQDACAQYDRLKSAVRSTRSQTSTLVSKQVVSGI